MASSFSRGKRLRETPYVGPPWWKAALWLVAALVFQLFFSRYLTFHDAAPSAVLAVVVWYAIRVNPQRAAVYGLAAGICEDVLATGTGGAWTISTTIVALLVSWLSRNFFSDSLPLAATIAFFATLLRGAIFWSVMSLEGYPAGFAATHVHATIWQALFNAVLIAIGILAGRRYASTRTLR